MSCSSLCRKANRHLEKLLHTGAHRLAVYFLADPGALQIDGADVKVPRTRAEHSTLQLASVAFLAHVLEFWLVCEISSNR